MGGRSPLVSWGVAALENPSINKFAGAKTRTPVTQEKQKAQSHKTADTSFARVSTHTSNTNHARTIDSVSLCLVGASDHFTGGIYGLVQRPSCLLGFPP